MGLDQTRQKPVEEEHFSKFQRLPYSFMRSYPLPLKVLNEQQKFTSIEELDIAYFDFGLEYPSFSSEEMKKRYLVITKGNVENAGNLLLRLNSLCPWGILASAQCDCHWQLESGKRFIAEEGTGMLIFAFDHTGKGVGLRQHHQINLEAHLKDPGTPLYEKDIWHDPFVAFAGKVDYRKFGDFADILGHYGITGVRMLTNNPAKMNALEGYGIKVTRVPFEAPADRFNRREYRIKREKGGHLLKIEPSWKKNLRRNGLKAAMMVLCAGIGASALLGYNYQRIHRFDELTAEQLERFTPEEFADYAANAPDDENEKIAKWSVVEEYLQHLEQKAELTEPDIEKVGHLFRKGTRIMFEMNAKRIATILKNHKDWSHIFSAAGP